MGSTFSSLHYHLIFGTKNIQPFIAPEWRHRLHAYLAACVEDLNAVSIIVNGVADHVHLLTRLRPTHRISDVLRGIKSPSSRWVHDVIGLRAFGWQDGYSAFAVSPSQVERVRAYIDSQEEHHRQRTFREEYLEFLEASGVEYDPRYVFS